MLAVIPADRFGAGVPVGCRLFCCLLTIRGDDDDDGWLVRFDGVDVVAVVFVVVFDRLVTTTTTATAAVAAGRSLDAAVAALATAMISDFFPMLVLESYKVQDQYCTDY